MTEEEKQAQIALFEAWLRDLCAALEKIHNEIDPKRITNL
jgi:hypothetical protein